MNTINRFFGWLNGGFNVPRWSDVEAAPQHKPDPPLARGLFDRLFRGGLPSDEAIRRAPSTWVETVDYPVGVWGWLCGGYNVPRIR